MWHNDQIVEIENFSDKRPYPRYTWWVKLRTTSGIVGWTIFPRKLFQPGRMSLMDNSGFGQRRGERHLHVGNHS